MKKTLVIICLFVLIMASFSFVLLRLWANGPDTSEFNLKYRPVLARYIMLRKILGLHYDGDARADYLGNDYDKIVIEIDMMQGLTIPNASLELLRDRIHAVTGKQVLIADSDVIPYEDNLTDDQIAVIVKKYRNTNLDAAKVYLLYLSEYEDNIDHLGSTYQEYGILLFNSALVNFTRSDPETLDDYIESTALHEFGHQLGLAHNEVPDCLMGEHAEINHIARQRSQDVVVDFCDYEKKLIQANSKI